MRGETLVRLDQKSARRIATGVLKAEDQEVKTAIASLESRSSKGMAQTGSPVRRRLEETVKQAFGDTLIGGGWSSRTYIYFVFEVLKVADGMPLQLAINGWFFNTRSNAEKVSQVALITMHAMERLMERRYDADLVRLARDEFDMDFVSTLVFGKDGKRPSVNEEFKIRTTHGWACGIVSETGLPIVRTWIHKPGE